MIAASLYLYAALWPLFTLFKIVDFGQGIPDITVQNLLLLLAVGTIILSNAANNRSASVDRVFLWLMIYIVYVLANLMFNEVPSKVAVIRQLVQVYFLPYLGYFVITNYVERLNLIKLSYAILAGGVIVALIGIAEFVYGKNLVGPLDSAMMLESAVFRTNGPFLDAITYASILLLYFAFAYYLREKALIEKRIGTLSMLIIGVGSFINFSRAGIIVLLAMLIIFSKRRLLVFGAAVASLAIISLFVVTLYPNLIEAITSSAIYQDRVSGKTVEGRWEMYAYVLDLIMRNLLVGIGYGNYGLHHILQTHNSYLQIFVELGLPGIVIFCAFIFLLGTQYLVSAKKAGDGEYFRAKAAILLTVLFIPNTINLLHSTHFLNTWMLIAATMNMLFLKSFSPRLSEGRRVQDKAADDRGIIRRHTGKAVLRARR